MSFDFIKNKDKKVHFIGIGGISMSGLAEILLQNGYKVSGSDRSSTPITEKLKSKGATIYIGHNENNILEADLVVYTAAIPSNNPEIKKAKELNIALMDRAEFLGHVMNGHKYNVSISGTHGKTTTTSMLSHIVLKANLDPTILVGGELDVINGNVRAGKSEYFLTEACEYKASFLKFQPYIGVILNIDSDHLDFYKDIDDIENTFLKFANLIPKDGFLIANFDDDRVKRVSSKINCNILSYGLNNGSLQAKNISYDSMGSSTFDVFKNKDFLFKVELNVPGKHNIQNALAAIGAALALNIDEKSICEGLKNFKSPHRRFEKKGIKNGITVIDDYAHHPTEIKAALNAAKNYPHKKIICVFQPHTYSRTKRLFNEFSTSFNYATEVILADIYAAREIDNGEINSEMLSNAIKKQGIKATNMHDFEDIVKYLKDISTEGDLILTVGAGDVFKVGEMFLK